MVRQRPARRQQPKRGGPGTLLLLVSPLLYCTAHDAAALDHLTLRVGQVSSPSVQAADAIVTLAVGAAPGPTLSAHLDQLRLPAPAPAFSDIEVGCAALIVTPPVFGCGQGTVSATGGPTHQIDVSAAGTFDSSTHTTTAEVSGLVIAGADTRFSGRLQRDDWSAQIHSEGLDLVAARRLLGPWLTLPDTTTLSGDVNLEVIAAGRLAASGVPTPTRATLTATAGDLNFSNASGTTVGQHLALTLTCSAIRQDAELTSDLQLRSTAGQALAGAVLLDLGLNPLDLRAHVQTDGSNVADLTAVQLEQKDLISVRGDARLDLTSNPLTVSRAHAQIQRLELAAAYRSLLQLTLAATDFGALNVGGHASGSLDIANNAIERVSADVVHFSAADSTARLSLANANGQLNWAAEGQPAVASSQLSWSSSSLYGLLGGGVALGFTAQGTDFALEGDTRLPIFDGAMVVHKLAVRRLGAPEVEMDFDAHIEPISMPRLSKAFGWPVLSGELAGRIPGVTYRDHVLAVDGDLIANMFDGTISASHLKLRDPFGPWPRLDATVSARELDLDLVTHTFAIGSISGRLDADIKDLELFNWSPIAFDASLHTTPGDRSAHLISQRAVTSISSVGGGGGGVAAALQSGVLKFFDKFHYDRIGISCELRDEVCLMSGIEPARDGYYLVKGRGIPRIDIIGNAGRVNWTQLVGQIAASMHSQNITVR